MEAAHMDPGVNKMATGQLNKVIDHLRSVLVKQEAAGITDADLVKRYVQQRDEAAFELLLRRHGPMVLGVCRRVLHNLHDAEDALQATFLVLVRRASSLRSPGMIGNWLYGVAYRTALHAREAAARRRAKEAEVVARTEPPDDTWIELRAVLDQELQRLPKKYRAIVALCDLEGRTRKEVARHLGWPEGTVASRLARGRVLLAKRLNRHGIAITGATLAALSQNASLSASLLVSTVKAARLVAAGHAAATGIVSVKAVSLMEGVLKAMLITKLKTIAVVTLVLGLGVGMGVVAYQKAGGAQPGPKQAASKPKPEMKALRRADLERDDNATPPHLGQLTITGTILIPNGSAAAGAVVSSRGDNEGLVTTVRTDSQGRFRLMGEFGNGCWLHAHSADMSHQTTFQVPEGLTRKRFATPVEMKLTPAREHVVTVTTENTPVEGA
jgi:RNA polymerase sigma factor (sigma-70 family)